MADLPPDAPPKGVDDEVVEAVSEIQTLLRGHTGRDDERLILRCLESLASEHFQQTLARLDVSRLLHEVDDYAFGVKHHQQLLDLLTIGRVHDLDVDGRVRVVRALQTGITRTIHEKAIRNLFVATKNAALTVLKDELDIGGGHRDLSQLLFSDIDNTTVREEILEHIRTASPRKAVGRKVLSDVDDTFYANWVDTRYPKKAVYPGVRAFYQVLGRREGGRPAGVTFLTARPADRAGLVENRTHASVARYGLTLPSTVLGGDLLHLHSHARIAKKKLQNFHRYRALFPEYTMVFVGDSGQGDADVGREMLNAAGDVVDAVFIHDVRGATTAERETFRRDGVLFFDTYLGAALEAKDLGLIESDDLTAVASAVDVEFDEIAFESDTQRAERGAEVAADKARLAARRPPV